MDLSEEYKLLAEEINIGSIADGELRVTEFFNLFSSISSENGDTCDLEYSPVIKEGNGGYRIDGYAFEIIGDELDGSIDLYIVICDFYQNAELPTINNKDVMRLIDGVERFVKAVSSIEFIKELEESSPAYQLAILIHQYGERISRIRCVVFSNAILKVRKNIFETRSVGNTKIHINVLDLTRYVQIAYSGSESVEVDFEDDFQGSIKCLPASVGTSSYKSYLFAIPGKILAEVFAEYGNRLLEQNVRTFLQARTNVNKGILKTISEEPWMFFAYNNGVTATASEVNTTTLEGGSLGISYIKDFQIVNGGQTTASLLYARDALKYSLDDVHVQVKLSVVERESLDSVVPKISEYANTQNKVSLADLASNSPVQIRIERLSKEVNPPIVAGELYAKKWFYERARGQYKNLFAYKTSSERKKLEHTYPKDHLILKTDLAKYEMSYDGRPHHVSEGAQKCFNRYTISVLNKAGKVDGLNELWFKRLIAKLLLFTSLDKAIANSEWYKFDRGYKAQIVTYTVAACAEGFKLRDREIDLDSIWKNQAVSTSLLAWMLEEAKAVAPILKNPPDQVRNISEFAKKEFCWEVFVKGKVGKPTVDMLAFSKTNEEVKKEFKDGAKEERERAKLDFDVQLALLVPQAKDIEKQAISSNLASPKNIKALQKIASGNLNLQKAEKNALKFLLERLETNATE